MSDYLIPIRFAIILFPIVAAVFTVPYGVYQYNRYGAVLPFRVCIVFSFVLYIMTCYFLTVLPLPAFEDVASSTRAVADLVPFGCWFRLYEQTVFVLSDTSTWIPAMKQLVFYEPVLNIVMLIPLGIYLRYYFKRGFWTTLLIGFLLSLSFELIQLSALFGIYPRPYRLFQVDDLINNTLGACVGYLLAPIFGKFLPSREKLDEEAYRRSGHVSFMRKVFSIICDWALLGALAYGVNYFFGTTSLFSPFFFTSHRKTIFYIIGILIYFVLLPRIFGGQTPGMKLVKIRLVNDDGEEAGLFQYGLRFGLQYLVVLPAPFYALALADRMTTADGVTFILLFLVIVFLAVLFLFFLFQLLISIITRKNRIFYEKISHTLFESTVFDPNDPFEYE